MTTQPRRPVIQRTVRIYRADKPVLTVLVDDTGPDAVAVQPSGALIVMGIRERHAFAPHAWDHVTL